MKCPDCNVEIKFHPEYCPHCGATLFRKMVTSKSIFGVKAFKGWFNAEIN